MPLEVLNPGGTAQPTTEGNSSLLYRAGYVVFTGRDAHQERSVEVLADEPAPTPSMGYAKWARIPRPQRKSLTFLEGYDPMTLTVPVLFDSVRRNGVAADQNIEEKIQWLEWMAGRGLKYPYQADGVGHPPLVVVYAALGNERESPLIPAAWQRPPTSPLGLSWRIDDLTFDERPLRDQAGRRIRQPAVVKLVEHVVDAVLPGRRPETGYRVFRSTAEQNTVRKIVAAHLAGPRSRLGEAVAATIKENHFNRRIGTNPEKHLRVNTPIRIPKKYLHI